MMHKFKVVMFALICVWLTACDQSSIDSAQNSVTIVDPTSAGGKLLKKYCSGCHAPPAATAHVADDWPNVVLRMQERRRMSAYELMPGDDMDILVEYLQRYAKG